MRNSGPEKQVELEVLIWAKQIGFDLSVIDTSAVWNPEAKRYLRRQASESLPDLIGNYGKYSVWVELKAHGKRSTINSKANKHQRAFLIRKIKQGCFAIVTDGIDHFKMIWNKWINSKSDHERRAILLEDLPQARSFLFKL